MDKFELHSEYKPNGDQPQVIAELVEGFKKGNQLGVSVPEKPLPWQISA